MNLTQATTKKAGKAEPIAGLYKKPSGAYVARIQYKGQRHKRDLATVDQRTAIVRMRKLRRDLEAGRAAALEQTRQRTGTCTLSPILTTYAETTRARVSYDSRRQNLGAFCRVIDEGLGLDLPKGMGSYKVLDANLLTIGKLSADCLDGELIEKFKLSRHGTEKEQAKAPMAESVSRMRGTVSLIKQARALFKTKRPNIMHKETGIYTHLKLPATLSAFCSEETFELNRKIYTLPNDAKLAALWRGLPELRATQPEIYKAFTIGVGMGLRVSEVGNLRWDALRWREREQDWAAFITEHDDYVGTKSRQDRAVPMPEGLHEDIEDLKTDVVYIIKGSSNWRKNRLTDAVGAWMRSRGWTRRLCMHEMRKWFGAELATQTGDLYLVSKVLGHADYQTTLKTYEALTNLPSNKLKLPWLKEAQKADQLAG